MKELIPPYVSPPHQPAHASLRSRMAGLIRKFVVGKDFQTKELPPGMKFTPLYRECPRCGLDFSKHFVDSGDYKKYTDNIEKYSKPSVLAWVPFAHKFGQVTASVDDYSLKGVVDPLSSADREKANGNKRGCSSWKFWQKSRPGENENENTGSHDNLVPVVKRKFRERILHWFGVEY